MAGQYGPGASIFVLVIFLLLCLFAFFSSVILSGWTITKNAMLDLLRLLKDALFDLFKFHKKD